MQLCMSITSYTVISIANLLFGSDNLTDENNLIVVFRNGQKYIHHTNRFEWYEIILCTQDMLSFICTQSPYLPLLLFIKYIHVYFYYIM